MAFPELRAAGEKAAAKEKKEVEVKAPAGLEVGDLEILIVGTTTATIAKIASAGGGAWTAMEGSPIDVTAGERLSVWTRERKEGDGSPKVNCETSDHVVACRLAAKKGTFNTLSSIEIIKTGTETTSDTSFAFKPEKETAGENRLCIVICTSGVDSNTSQGGTNTANTSLTEVTATPIANYQTAEGNGGGFFVASGKRATAGTAGEWTNTLVGASPKAYISFAIRPAVSAFTVEPTDTVALADSVSKAASVTTSDSTALADAVSKAAGLVTSDSVALADAAVRAVDKVAADAVALAESVGLGVGKSAADTVELNDSVSKDIASAQADAVSLEDALVEARLFKFVELLIEDAVSLVDAVVRGVTHSEADGAALSDAVSKAVGLSEADTVALADTAAKSASVGASDAVSLSDSVSKGIARVVADAVELIDSAVTHIGELIIRTASFGDEGLADIDSPISEASFEPIESESTVENISDLVN